MGEKFAANPVTGTGSMTVPLATSPGRSGFGPDLTLSYDSGAGNGPFGFGWSLSLPSISRKTDKGLPQYRDTEESDVFILSGAEDMVPAYRLDAAGQVLRDPEGNPLIHEDERDGYRIRRYRPRIEGLFARIERWTHVDTGEIHWRSISRDNIMTLYGRDNTSRLFDPADPAPEHPTHIFSWLICASFDDKGNGIVYQYAAENSDGVDTTLVHERNRTAGGRSANRYLKRILYGNPTTLLTDGSRPQYLTPAQVEGIEWMFEVVFDYGEGHFTELPLDPARPPADQHRMVHASHLPAAGATWPVRPDPFSSYRAGFEVRTYRRCQHVLMFHRFAELGDTPSLVRATSFHYDDFDYSGPDPIDAATEHTYPGSTRLGSVLRRITQSGYVRQPAAGDADRYLERSLPPLEFTYSQARIQDRIRQIDTANLENLPIGLDGQLYQWVDLDGEGLSGILTEQAGAWLYKRNLGNGRFAPQERLAAIPSLASLTGSRQQLLDLAGDGQLELVDFGGSAPGFFERTPHATWDGHVPFRSLPILAWDNPNLRFVDLDGDGRADVLITEQEVLTWYPSLGEAGFGAAAQVRTPADEERGPRLVFADGEQSIYLADMSGDGLTDLVRIRNGEVCYWPNLGYGHFGTRVTMDGSPWFDYPDQFDQRRIRLADVDGSGVVDIVYLGRGEARIYFNQSGNRWSRPRRVTFPRVDALADVTVVDLLGNGTACLVWSSPLPGEADRPLRYIDLMGGQKPRLLVITTNNLGATTTVQYVSSTRFYLQDRLAGKPWITRLPFPVHCVEKVTVTDRRRNTTFSATYSYHHGYFDGVEREFRGFGRVEQVDSEAYGEFTQGNSASPYITDNHRLYQPPVKTVTWYHTGLFVNRRDILSHYAGEYFPQWFNVPRPGEPDRPDRFREAALPEPDLIPLDLTADEWREALRACKGMALRQEIYELDVDALENDEHRPVKLFSAAMHNCHIERLQPQGRNRHAVFLVTESEAITYHYELDLRTERVRPDPRIAHTLNLATDRYGNVLQSVAAVYPRRGQFEDGLLSPEALARIRAVQQERHLVYTETRYTNDVDDTDNYRLRVPGEVLTYELTGISPEDVGDRATADPRDNYYFALDELRRFYLSREYQTRGEPVAEIAYHQLPHRDTPQKRCVEQVRMLYFQENLRDPLPFRTLNRLGLPYETYKLALTEDLLDAILQNKLTAEVRGLIGDARLSGYSSGIGPAGQYWQRSGIAGFADDAARHFYLPERYTDPFGNVTSLEYDARDLYIASSTDALGNTTRVMRFDYRVLAPAEMADVNDNRSEVIFDALGLPTAMAVKGKGAEGDDLTGFDDARLHPTPATLIRFFTGDYEVGQAQLLLGNATARHVYYFGEVRNADGSIRWGVHPACACGIVREQHVAHLEPDQESPLQAAFEYSDGMGTVLVKKIQAEPEAVGGPLRWIASGKTILNNKGKPVKQYEPYFSPNGHHFEELLEVGVTPVLYYDAVGRTIRTEAPDGSYSRVEFSPWQVATYDANDTVLETDNRWYTDRHPLDPTRPLPVDARTFEPTATPDQRSAWLAAQHADTPVLTVLDTLGRDVVAIAHNRAPDASGTWHDEKYLTFTKLDAEGKPLWIRDARGNLVMQYVQHPPAVPRPISNRDEPVSYAPAYDIAGNLLFQHSMDGGDRWMLNDAAGKPMLAWDFNERQTDDGANGEQRQYLTEYDALHRPTAQRLITNGEPPGLIERYEYRDAWISADGTANPTLAADREANLLGQLVRHYDPSGLVETIRRDFKGNVLETRRKLVSAYTAPVVDWSDHSRTAVLEDETWVQITGYDALNRMKRQYQWHKLMPDSRVAVYEPRYNERGLLAGEDLVVRATKTPVGYREGPRPELEQPSQRTHVILAIAYDARGQTQQIRRGNGTTTIYEYDVETFRLKRLWTERPTEPRLLQDLQYVYDPVGNITQIRDDAQQTAYFRNAVIEPHCLYEYDALYRLVRAKGREHAAQNNVQRDYRSFEPLMEIPFPNSPEALQRYTEWYTYDSAGNILRMRHIGGVVERWTRRYQYAPDSNRLLGTSLPGDAEGVYSAHYHYDTHGSMLNLNRVPEDFWLRWDYRDMIQVVNLGGGGWAYYNYEAGKERTRKVITNEAGDKQWERLYLGGMEVYRRFGAGGVVEEIESHHLFVGEQRVLLVEDVLATINPRLDVGSLFRYQYNNHLGSACVELDEEMIVISYEEYHPYGTTAYHAINPTIRTAAKRYRYTGRERDGETGLNYHSARYLALWLGRWAGVDALGPVDGLNLYVYVRDNPTRHSDLGGTQSQRPSPLEDEANASDTLLHSTYGPPRTSAPEVNILEERNRVSDPVLHLINRSDAPPPVCLTPPRESQASIPYDPDPLEMDGLGRTSRRSETVEWAGRRMSRQTFRELSNYARTVPLGYVSTTQRLRNAEDLSSLRQDMALAANLYQGIEATIQQRNSNMGRVYDLHPVWLLPPRRQSPEATQDRRANPPQDLADRVDLPGINQQRGSVDERSGQNCGPTASATALTLMGSPTVVTRGGRRSMNELREMFFPSARIQSTRSQNAFEQRLLAQPNGSVAIVDTFWYRDRGHGHFLVAINWNGRVYYADGQTGQWILPARHYTFDAFMIVGRTH